MPPSLHFSPAGPALTAESARVALYLWLRGLGLDGDAEAASGDAPPWHRSLPALEECEPSPWGQWSGRTPVAELRELGVLPEALVNFLALTARGPPPGASPAELPSRERLVALWTPERLRTQPARFAF